MSYIQLKDIYKVYPPDVLALEGVNFSLEKGEIHSIIGENGAGKSTLMKILYGMVPPSSGEIFINNQEQKITNPNVAIKLGIGMVHQEFMLVPSFKVYENVVLGLEKTKNFGFLDKEKILNELEEITKKFNLSVDLQATTSNLSVAAQQKVEILKLLYRKVDTLIFDEPTAVLTPQETHQLFKEIRNIRDTGKTIVFISHKLEEVLEISDIITVMRRGKVISTLKNENFSKGELAKMMVGKEVMLTVKKAPKEPGKEVFKCENLTVVSNKTKINLLSSINIVIRSGEIVGLAGVEGNGQYEIVQAIIGEIYPNHGKIFIEDQNITELTIRKRRSLISYIPADRKRYGLALNAALTENLSMTHHLGERLSKFRYIMDWKKAKKFAKDLINQYNILSRSINDVPKNLSGGNQQKLIVAREFSLDAPFLLLDQPTRGLDVGSIEYVHNVILEMREKGKGILMISADLDELLSMCDRLYVVRKGEIVAELDPKIHSKEEVGQYMLGAKL